MSGIRIVKVPKKVNHPISNFPNYLDDRIGFWAVVDSVDSVTNRVDVIADTGQKILGLPVTTNEWVNTEKHDYVTGERNLPPKDSRVFVLMPTHTITGAFVLCSGYAPGETKSHNLYASGDNDREEKNNIIEKVSQGGWNKKEYAESGNIILTSKDNNIKLELNLDNNGDIKKGTRITAWNSVIEITENGLKITASKDIEIDAGTNDLKVTCNSFDVNNGNLTVN